MLSKQLLQLSLELELTTTAHSAFGRTNGVVFAITSIGGPRHQFYINLSHVDPKERAYLTKLFIKKLPKGPMQDRYDKITDTLEISYSLSFLTKEESIKKIYQSVLNAIGTSFPPSPKVEIEMMGLLPILITQKSEIAARTKAQQKPLLIRFGRAVGLCFLALMVLGSIAHLFPKYSYLGLHPVFLSGLIILSASQLLRGISKEDSTISLEIAALILSFAMNALVWLFVMLHATIPPEYKGTMELFLLMLGKWLHSGGMPTLLIAVGLSGAFVFSIFQIKFGTQKNQPIKLNQSLLLVADSRKRARKKIAIILVIMIFGGLAIGLGSSNIGPHDENWGNSWIINVLVGAIYLLTAGLLSIFCMTDSNIRASFETDGRVSRLKLAALSLFAPIIFVFGIYTLLIRLDSSLDSTAPEDRIAIVSKYLLPEVTLAACYGVVDPKTGEKVAGNACLRNDQYLRNGNQVRYKYKPGIFNNGITFGREFVHPKTWEQLLSEKNDVSDVRSIDIEFLKTIPTEKNRIDGPLFNDWKTRCDAGEAAYCRLAAYAVQSEKLNDESAKLLSKGCDLNEYVSCYGLLLIKKDDTVFRKELGLSLDLCRNKTMEACEKYAELWRDDKTEGSRKAIQEVLGLLCTDGDSISCDRIIWERSRI